MLVEIHELINDLIVNYFSTGKYARPSQSARVHSPALGSYWLISDGVEQCRNEVVKIWWGEAGTSTKARQAQPGMAKMKN